MDDVSMHVSKHYMVKCKSAIRHKADFICRTDAGVRVLKRFSGSIKDAERCHKLTESLYLNGFQTLELVHRTKDNAAYSVYNGDIYTLSDYFPYRESDFSDRTDLLSITGELAKLHLTGKSVAKEFQTKDSTQNASDVYSKSVKALANYRRFVLAQARMSDFDVVVMKTAEYYTDRLKRWKSFVSDNACFPLETNTICHGNLKEESLRINEPVYFANFSRAYVGNGVNDLKDVLRRHIKKAEKPVPASEITAFYVRVNPLSKNELNGLYGTLLFPDKYLSLCARFYSKKRNFVPVGLYQRLLSETESALNYEDYINGLL